LEEKKMRTPKPSAAIILACAALVVALGGTAIAASHYIITSTSQIKPSVLRALATAASTSPEVEVVSAEVSLKPGQGIGFARAECPHAGSLGSSPVTSTGDYHLVTGGYGAELAPGAKILMDQPAGARAWMFVVNNSKGIGVSGFRAYALCAPGHVISTGPSGSFGISGTE
jgi:hypothetical protein